MGIAGYGNACQKGSKMPKFQKSKAKTLQAILIAAILASSVSVPTTAFAEKKRSDLQILEESIFDGDWKTLPGIEVKVAQIEVLQVRCIREQAVGQRASEQVALE